MVWHTWEGRRLKFVLLPEAAFGNASGKGAGMVIGSKCWMSQEAPAVAETQGEPPAGTTSPGCCGVPIARGFQDAIGC